MTSNQSTAYHEAAHSVVNFRAVGFVGGNTSVMPNADQGTLGECSDGWSDSFNEEHIRGRVLSCYAGAHAERKLGLEPWGHEQDERIAAEHLREWGWNDREQELREESRVLVDRHWAEIVAVAQELLRVQTLDDTEVEIIADIAAGVPDVSSEDLKRYRALRDDASRRGVESP